jgi:hypothetical protein
LSVDVGGRWLTLEARASDLSTAELARIADGITVFPNVSLEWLGR